MHRKCLDYAGWQCVKLQLGHTSLDFLSCLHNWHNWHCEETRRSRLGKNYPRYSSKWPQAAYHRFCHEHRMKLTLMGTIYDHWSQQSQHIPTNLILDSTHRVLKKKIKKMIVVTRIGMRLPKWGRTGRPLCCRRESIGTRRASTDSHMARPMVRVRKVELEWNALRNEAKTHLTHHAHLQ